MRKYFLKCDILCMMNAWIQTFPDIMHMLAFIA